jgi:hypothetical protein
MVRASSSIELSTMAEKRIKRQETWPLQKENFKLTHYPSVEWLES